MYKTVEEYLSIQNIPYKTNSDSTEAMIQCLFCDDKKTHLYINNTEGCWVCHRCNVRGSWYNLVEHLGDPTRPKLESITSSEYSARLAPKKEPALLNAEVVESYAKNLPEKIVTYLTGERRGLTSEIINQFKIGWDGSSITIPVFDNAGVLINIRHRRDPDKSEGQKYWNEKGGKAALFNIQALTEKTDSILICEGEFDVMMAEQNGFSAVCGTAGAGTFKEEWVHLFDGIKQIYLCFDTDEAGRTGAARAASMLGSRVKLVELPSAGDNKIDITEYLLHHTREDFQALLDKAVKPSKSISFEIVDSQSDPMIHPALDAQEAKLFITLQLPIKIGNDQGVKQVLITSDRESVVVVKDRVYLDEQQVSLRKVVKIPNERLRWKSELVQEYLSSDGKISPALPFIEIKTTLEKFIDFNSTYDSDILTLWLMGTYCFPIFEAFPYLYLVGVKRSGKTKTLLLIERLGFNAILSSNISPSVLFRLIEARRATLALDESEQLSDKTRKQELKELLNAGYKRGVPAYRMKKSSKGQFEIERFEIYSPKVIANISGLDDVLEDRSITITMVRTNNPEKGNLAVTEGSEDWEYLRSLLYRFSLDYAGKLLEIYLDDPDVNALLNRQNELWKPLLTIARIVEEVQGGLFEQIRDEAVRRSEVSTGMDLADFDEAVLQALKQLTSEVNDGVELSNKEIKTKAHEFLEEDQREYLTSRGVGAALKRFGIQGKKIQGSWRYTVSVDSIQQLLVRYGISSDW